MDKKLIDQWKKLNNVLIGTTKGGRNNQAVNFTSDGKTISAKCFGDVAAGEAIALRDDDGQWYVYKEIPAQVNQQFSSNRQYRKTGKKRKTPNFTIYVESIGINLSDDGISIEVKNHETSAIFSEVKYGNKAGQEIEIEFDATSFLKEKIDPNLNPDADNIVIVYSDKSSKFTADTQVAYQKRTTDNGVILEPPDDINDTEGNFCITNCKPFTLFTFISTGTTDENPQTYTRDLSFYFNNPVPALIRKIKAPDDENRNFISLWRFRDINAVIYGRGYVSDSGFLKKIDFFTGTAGLRDDYVFYSNYAYSATMAIQIGCGDVFNRRVTWFNPVSDSYQTEGFADNYLPFSMRDDDAT